MRTEAVRAMLFWSLVALFAVSAHAQTPRINEGGVVNAAGYRRASPNVAAGSIVTIFGTGMAAEVNRASSIPLPTTLGTTQVFFNEIPAPLIAVGPLQVSAQVPWEIAGGSSANVRVIFSGVASNVVAVPLGAQGPGLFATNEAGTGQGAILVSGTGGSVAAPAGVFRTSRPIVRGEEYLEIYATGLGAVTNQPASGAPGSSDPLSRTIVPAAVTIGGLSTEVAFSGLSPQFPALYQINARVPAEVPAREDVEVVVRVGEVSSNPVTIAVGGRPGEVLVSRITPATIDAGSSDTTLLIEGAGFTEQSVAQVNGTPVSTTFLSAGRLRAVLPASLFTQSGSLAVTVAGGTAQEALLAVRTVVRITPASITVTTGGSQQFNASVIGISATGVTWSIEGAGAGNATVGTVSLEGRYTSPGVVPEPATIRIRATSVSNPSLFGVATVTVASPAEDWPKYRRDLSNTGHSAETGLSSANIHRLQRKWRFQTGDIVSASPAVATVNGIRTVYIPSWNGSLYALNADTGALRWSFPVDKAGTNCAGSRCRLASSPAVDGGIVYFGAENAFLYAVNAITGALLWKRQLGNPDTGHEIWSSPAVHNGRVYVGMASHESVPCVIGRVFALDALTGAIRWQFDTIDQASCPFGTCVGGGVWSSPAIDTQFGILYIGTGNPGQGCSPASANATRYPNSLLALDLSTGRLRSFHQAYPNDIGDLGDVGASAVLHRTEVANQCQGTSQVGLWVSVPSKNGVLHTLQRGSSGLAGSPVTLALNSGDTIASPGLRPFTESQSCGPGGSQSIQTGNDLYVPTFNGFLFGIRQNATTAGSTTSVRWQRLVQACAVPNTCPLASAPAVIADLVFFGGGEGNFYATTTDGTIVLAYGTEGLVASGPAISHGTVYFGSYDGYLYALSLDGQ